MKGCFIETLIDFVKKIGLRTIDARAVLVTDKIDCLIWKGLLSSQLSLSELYV